MRGRNLRIFDDAGRKCQFSNEKFVIAMKEYQREQSDDKVKLSLQSIKNALAERLCVSPDAIKKWQQGYNGPSDLQTVKEIAVFFNVNYTRLLVDIDENNEAIVPKREVNMNIADKNDIVLSILNDMQEMIGTFESSYGYTKVPEYEENEKNLDRYGYYQYWQEKIMLKLNLNRYWVNEDTYKRIEHLLLETCGFVISQQGPKRWCEINKVWTLFENLDFEDEDTLISEWFEIIDKSTNPYQLEEEVIDFLNNQYTGCHFGWVGDFDTYYSIGLRIGSWYLEIIKHDFPELFIMD